MRCASDRFFLGVLWLMILSLASEFKARYSYMGDRWHFQAFCRVHNRWYYHYKSCALSFFHFWVQSELHGG